MGPFVEVFVYNRAPIKRTVRVWGYLVSYDQVEDEQTVGDAEGYRIFFFV
jgi:hypothetical protein